MVVFTLNDECSFKNKCRLYDKIGCSGCSFQHFDRIDVTNDEDLALLKENYFQLIQEKKKSKGGRVALDVPMRNLVLSKLKSNFPEIRTLESKNIRSTIEIDGETVDYEIKCDGAFQYKNKYIFYELKGYGDNTNDIFSAITASQLIKEDSKFKNHRFYFMGINGANKKNKHGVTRESFFDPKSRKVTPYTKWAEDKGFIKFYGILNIEDFIPDITDYLNKQ
jgi:hypothetical protein